MINMPKHGRYELSIMTYDEDSNTWTGNLKEIKHSDKKTFPSWKKLSMSSEINDDSSYLVAWQRANGTYSQPIRAWWDPDEECFIPTDSHFIFPLDVDIYLEIPEANDILSFQCIKDNIKR